MNASAIHLGFRPLLASVFLALLLLVGCSSEAADTPSASEEVPTASAGPATEIRLEVTGGAFAGTYDTISERATCSEDLVGAGAWGNQFFEPEQEGLQSLQLIVPDAESAAGGTGEFNVSVRVNGETYTVETRPDRTPQGSGTVTVDRSASPAKVELDVQTADGVALRSMITCHEVMRLS